MPDPLETLARLGGAATSRRLELAGVDRHALKRLADRGDLVRLARGRYALPACLDPRRTAVQLGGLASHLTAAQLWGLEVARASERVHVTIARTRSRARAGGAVLHWADLTGADVDDHVTSPLRTVLDCVRTLPRPEGLAVADSALRRRLVDADELLVAAGRLAGPGRGRAAWVAQHADPRAANPFESQLRALAIDAGLSVEPQTVLRTGRLTARVDLYDRRRHLVLEADSWTYHTSRSRLAKDCHRYNELQLAGEGVLRFAWEQVNFSQDWVSEVLARAAVDPPGRRVTDDRLPVGHAVASAPRRRRA